MGSGSGIALTKRFTIDLEPDDLQNVASDWYALSLGHYEEAQVTIRELTMTRGLVGLPVLLHAHESGRPCNDRCLLISGTEANE